jgi:hypothetical protein
MDGKRRGRGRVPHPKSRCLRFGPKIPAQAKLGRRTPRVVRGLAGSTDPLQKTRGWITLIPGRAHAVIVKMGNLANPFILSNEPEIPPAA